MEVQVDRSTTHPIEVVRSYEQLLKESAAEGRYIQINGGHKIHVVEAGKGLPVVILHGTGNAAYTLLPLLEHLEGVRAIAPDLPGCGLSDPLYIGDKGYRNWVIEVIDQMLDALEVDQISLAGASGGGVWAIWYALANPERVQRLILLTGIPMLPGTHPPLPLRFYTLPIIGALMSRMPADEKRVVNLMRMMGEGETIVNYPRIIEAFVATSNDPLARKAGRAEFSAFMNFLGFRTNMKIGTEDLALLNMPVLMTWGERDQLGGEDVARPVSEAIPNCVLEMMPTGHGPWLGYPDKTANLIQDFVLTR